jgi:ribosomal protein S27E
LLLDKTAESLRVDGEKLLIALLVERGVQVLFFVVSGDHRVVDVKINCLSPRVKFGHSASVIASVSCRSVVFSSSSTASRTVFYPAFASRNLRTLSASCSNSYIVFSSSFKWIFTDSVVIDELFC